MRTRFRIVALSLAVVLSAGMVKAQVPVTRQPRSQNAAASELRLLKGDPLRLRNFLKAMPKGGDLHNHLSGAVYAESYLRWAAEDHDCIDVAKLEIVTPSSLGKCKVGQVSAAAALLDPQLDDDLLAALSMYQYSLERTQQSGHDHFFATFPKFKAEIDPHWGDMLAEVTGRAAAQNELYLELILGIDHTQAGTYGTKVGWNDDLAADYDALLKSGIRDLVPKMRGWLDEGEQRRARTSHCGASTASAGCAVTVRYIYEVYRGLPKEQVFAQLVAGFEIAQIDARVVAVNLVMPEDWYVPMHDYDLHMRMVGFLHSKYPRVHITLHAGELAPGWVPYEGLRSHIREAVEIGHAQRIGHGVDIMYEDAPEELMGEMARRKVAVEICLTSNRIILGVTGKMHPLNQYRRAGVPVVLATDDEGVSRAEMTDEYMQAVLDQGLSYADLKQMARDSIRYSFADAAIKQRLSQCLEVRFAAFERNPSAPPPPCPER